MSRYDLLKLGVLSVAISLGLVLQSDAQDHPPMRYHDETGVHHIAALPSAEAIGNGPRTGAGFHRAP